MTPDRVRWFSRLVGLAGFAWVFVCGGFFGLRWLGPGVVLLCNVGVLVSAVPLLLGWTPGPARGLERGVLWLALAAMPLLPWAAPVVAALWSESARSADPDDPGLLGLGRHALVGVLGLVWCTAWWVAYGVWGDLDSPIVHLGALIGLVACFAPFVSRQRASPNEPITAAVIVLLMGFGAGYLPLGVLVAPFWSGWIRRRTPDQVRGIVFVTSACLAAVFAAFGVLQVITMEVHLAHARLTWDTLWVDAVVITGSVALPVTLGGIAWVTRPRGPLQALTYSQSSA